MMESWLNLA